MLRSASSLFANTKQVQTEAWPLILKPAPPHMPSRHHLHSHNMALRLDRISEQTILNSIFSNGTRPSSPAKSIFSTMHNINTPCKLWPHLSISNSHTRSSPQSCPLRRLRPHARQQIYLIRGKRIPTPKLQAQLTRMQSPSYHTYED
jgi:hypothetical protein